MKAYQESQQKLKRLGNIFDRVVYLQQAEDEVLGRFDVLLTQGGSLEDVVDLEEERAMSMTRLSWIKIALSRVSYEIKKEETWQKSLSMTEEDADGNVLPWPLSILQ